MKKIIVILMSLLLVAGCTMSNDKKVEEKKMMSLGNMYDFELEDLDGNIYKLSDQKGKKVYIKFWASWCPICLSGLEELNDLSKEDNNFEVISIVSLNHNGEKNKEDFIKWFKSLDYKNIKVLLDKDGEVFSKFDVRAMPTNAIIDVNGNVVKIIPGPIEKELIKKIYEEVSMEK